MKDIKIGNFRGTRAGVGRMMREIVDVATLSSSPHPLNSASTGRESTTRARELCAVADLCVVFRLCVRGREKR